MPPPPPNPPDPPSRLREQGQQALNANSTRLGTSDWATEMEMSDAMTTTGAEDELMEAWLEVTSQHQRDGSVSLSPIVTKLLTVLLKKVSETLKEACKTAHRVEKLEAQIARLGSNPHPPPTKPMSWVSAAKFPTKPLSSHPSILPRPQPPPPAKVVNTLKPSHVIIRKPDDKMKTPFKDCAPTEIVEGVTKALRKVDAKVDDRPIEVKAAQLLPSGDIKLYTATRREANWLLNNRHVWSALADPELVTQPPKFPVILHSVPAHIGVECGVFAAKLADQNDWKTGVVQGARWLSNPKTTGKAFGSVVLNLYDQEISKRVESGGVYCDSYYIRGSHYKKSPTQCYKCLEIGHISSRCNNVDPICAHCSEAHETIDCPARDAPSRCARCLHTDLKTQGDAIDRSLLKYAHSAKSMVCPLRKERTTVIQHNKPRTLHEY